MRREAEKARRLASPPRPGELLVPSLERGSGLCLDPYTPSTSLAFLIFICCVAYGSYVAGCAHHATRAGTRHARAPPAARAAARARAHGALDTSVSKITL